MQAHPGFQLDWNLVRTFVGVAEAGSLSAGARQLGITHPTVARHVQQLEASIGMVLFNRTAQGLVLNEAGEKLLDSARAMHAGALAFQATTDGVRAGPVQRVRISVAQILAELLPDVMLSELNAAASSDGPSIDMLVTDDLLDLLQRDTDIALRHARPEQQELICKRVGYVEMGVFAHRDYVASHGVVRADNLHLHRYVDGLTRNYLSRGAARKGLHIQPDQVILRSDSIACQRAAVNAGWGVAAFPQWMASLESEWECVYPSEEVINVEVWLVARPEIRNSEHLKGLFTRLGECLYERLGR